MVAQITVSYMTLDEDDQDDSDKTHWSHSFSVGFDFEGLFNVLRLSWLVCPDSLLL